MNDHYFTNSPSSQVKILTVSESLRRHLYIFKTLSGVFSFKKIDLGTKILIENMFIPQGSHNLLDLGCGYGVIGIVLAHESPQSTIFMTDINKRAIWCSKENVKINIPTKETKVNIVKGSYFEPFEDGKTKFDAIYMNPPLRKGKQEFLTICKQIPTFLKENGFFQFVIRRKMGAQAFFDTLKALFPNGKIDVVAKKSGYWVFFLSFSLKT